MMNPSRIIRFLFISFLTISCACKNPQGEGKSTHPVPQIKKAQSSQPKLKSPAGESKDYVPGEIVIKFHEGTKETVIQGIMRDLHLETIRIVSEPDLYLLKILDGSSVESVLERVGKYKEVQYSEPNYRRTRN
jgi:hypothetical protein